MPDIVFSFSFILQCLLFPLLKEYFDNQYFSANWILSIFFSACWSVGLLIKQRNPDKLYFWSRGAILYVNPGSQLPFSLRFLDLFYITFCAVNWSEVTWDFKLLRNSIGLWCNKLRVVYAAHSHVHIQLCGLHSWKIVSVRLKGEYWDIFFFSLSLS